MHNLLASDQLRFLQTDQLRIAYFEHGDANGWPCILLHGFPYDVLCYQECVKPLVNSGARVYVPYLRGFGPTEFISSTTMRSGEQAALANDLLQFMDALNIRKATLGGFDWGGRAACIVAAIRPERVYALVTGNSYNIQNIANAMQPASAEEEAGYWYQYYFHSQRGELGLTQNRREIAQLLWSMWSPTWSFSQEAFDNSAASLHNPDFVAVVIHSYRHRYGLVEGDPHVAAIEKQLVKQPDITVPTVCIDGDRNGVSLSTKHHAKHFTHAYTYRVFENAGHNLPQEKPLEWVQAIMDARELQSD